MDDIATIGARLRVLRRWRGMTQAQVAGLAGLLPSQISMIETGQRSLDRRSQISAIATALRVSETDLVGGPHLSSDHQQSDPHTVIPALREALLTSRLGTSSVDRARPLPELSQAVTDLIEPTRAKCDYLRAGRALPGVLDELHWHVAQPADEAAWRLALESLIEACVAATLMAKNLGYMDLASIVARRAEEAAALLEDPVQVGKAAVTRVWAFSREGSWEHKRVLIEQAADELEPHAQSPLGRQVLGMITLTAALAGAVTQRADLVSHWLGEADRLAAPMPDDMTASWQQFCRTNVGVWRVAISVERGEAGGAVRSLAASVQQDKLEHGVRKAQFLADVGRGLARDKATRIEAIQWLRRAENAGPQHIRNNAAARETIAYLLSRSRADAGGRELRGMAARMGMPH